MNIAIQTQGLSRAFGAHRAVEAVDLNVPEASVYGFLGRNGAGKTTLIRLILGLLRPDRGRIRIFGLDLAAHRVDTARSIGALVETPSHYDHLTGRQNLDITRRLLGLDAAETDHVLELVDLRHAGGRRVGGYSLGMRQRLGLARALLGSPRLLVVDEPTNGLDPEGILAMRALLARLPERSGATVFVSSHILSEVEQFATHVGLMHAGRLLLEAPLDAAKARGDMIVSFRVDRPEPLVAILASSGIAALVEEGGTVRVAPAAGRKAATAVPWINAQLVERGIAVNAIEVREPSLEDIFHATVATAGCSAGGPRLAA
ncbi:ABC transporter ATP-binding protein [Sphingosinicella rhizophila]|uniref:ABC transporter ATP-binding protein n=1 Tax=Sphingosinicella rhizophila TaxID=3050082 RepID=A0ABU3QBF2_9SPHN|nr:ABC transporter ATP-binding protein [Sphingosinicella sp. GR2756]MDT9600706.1 ABC transporter ATP-binding protein [Sphingosinicella sp. GR2756]